MIHRGLSLDYWTQNDKVKHKSKIYEDHLAQLPIRQTDQLFVLYIHQITVHVSMRLAGVEFWIEFVGCGHMNMREFQAFPIGPQASPAPTFGDIRRAIMLFSDEI
jgi:hypothetical protein